MSEEVAQKQEDYIVFTADDVKAWGRFDLPPKLDQAVGDVIVLTMAELEQIRQEGYEEGAEANDGYDAGYDDGYQQGYDEGVAENEDS